MKFTLMFKEMFITVRFGDNRTEIFNPHCKICILLDYIKERCDCQKEDIIDLSDQTGVRKNLHLNLMDYAIKHVEERDVLVLIKIERFPGSVSDTCVPLLHGLQGDKDFLNNLNKNLNEEPNSQEEPERRRNSNVLGRRASVNLKKQKSSFVAAGGKRANRTTRSQSIAVAGGSTPFTKLSKKGR